jgi:hypothetical protein
MFDSIRCQLRQFDAAWKVGLVVMAVVIVIGIMSRWSYRLDMDQDPVVRKKIIQFLQEIKQFYSQAQQDTNPAMALLHIGNAKGLCQASLALASVDQIYKSTQVNMTDLGLKLNQLSDQIRTRAPG